MLYQNEIIIWTNEHWILTIPLDIFMCMLSSILPCLSVSSNPLASCLVFLSLEKVAIEVCDINQLMTCNWKFVVRRQFIRYRNRILITYFEDIRSSLCFSLGHYLKWLHVLWKNSELPFPWFFQCLWYLWITCDENNFFILITRGVRASLRAPRLIPGFTEYPASPVDR